MWCSDCFDSFCFGLVPISQFKNMLITNMSDFFVHCTVINHTLSLKTTLTFAVVCCNQGTTHSKMDWVPHWCASHSTQTNKQTKHHLTQKNVTVIWNQLCLSCTFSFLNITSLVSLSNDGSRSFNLGSSAIFLFFFLGLETNCLPVFRAQGLVVWSLISANPGLKLIQVSSCLCSKAFYVSKVVKYSGIPTLLNV